MPNAESWVCATAEGASMTPPTRAADMMPALNAAVFFLDKELPFAFR